MKVNKQEQKLSLQNYKLFPYLTITFAVLFANIFYIFITNINPIIQRSALNINPLQRLLYGQNTIDPNDGFNKQALGIQSIDQILHGHLPLWNHFEGIGMPLLGEMQSAALFPFTLLLKLPAGFLVYTIVLEIIAGIGMYLFLKHFGLNFGLKSKGIQIIGGILFGTTVMFSVFLNACFNPIAFLPWLMLGVQIFYNNFSSNSRINSNKKFYIPGIIIFSLSIALALYSGFPEITYIYCILIFVYIVVLFFRLQKNKLKFLLNLLFASVIGLMVSMPLLLEFKTFSDNGFLGIHENSMAYSGIGISKQTIMSTFMPFSLPIFTGVPFSLHTCFYVSISIIILAIVGVFYKKISIVFALWSIFAFLGLFGTQISGHILNIIPVVKYAATYRYITPSLSFALIILVCLGLQKIKQKKISYKLIVPLMCACFIFYVFFI
jgi:hypothetical protein